MKPKDLIYIFVFIVIIYFTYTYFIEKREPFTGKINESFRSTSRTVSNAVTDNYNSLATSTSRFFRQNGLI